MNDADKKIIEAWRQGSVLMGADLLNLVAALDRALADITPLSSESLRKLSSDNAENNRMNMGAHLALLTAADVIDQLDRAGKIDRALADTQKCPECDGEGMHEWDQSDDCQAAENGYEDYRCETCNGTGRLADTPTLVEVGKRWCAVHDAPESLCSLADDHLLLCDLRTLVYVEPKP